MHSRNTVRYYLAIAALLIFFFFSNDFGLIDIQKTAIIMAVGIDREDNTFIVTTQIAVPEASSQGEQAQAVQIESRGDTVADALSQINVKTGWYPKLVFCNLIIIGQEAAKRNVFDALDFFLRDEYMSDGCLVATLRRHGEGNPQHQDPHRSHVVRGGAKGPFPARQTSGNGGTQYLTRIFDGIFQQQQEQLYAHFKARKTTGIFG